MAMKCYTKLETAKERCPIVFQGHPSNFKVTQDKTSPILTQIGRFRTIGRLQLSNPSDLPCFNISFILLTFLYAWRNETTHRYYLCLCEKNWNDWYFGQYCKTYRVCLYWLRLAKSTCKPPSTKQLGKIHNRNRNKLLQYFMIQRKFISLICHRKLDDSYQLYHGFLKMSL